jgi:hypothetical protein
MACFGTILLITIKNFCKLGIFDGQKKPLMKGAYIALFEAYLTLIDSTARYYYGELALLA